MKYLCAIILTFQIQFANAQNMLCNTIQVVENLDSIQCILQNPTLTAYSRIENMLIINKSKIAYGTPITDNSFNTIDSIAIRINNKNAVFVNKLFQLKIHIENGLFKDKSIEIGNQLLQDFATIKDTSGILYTYFLLARANVLGVGTFPGAENLLVNNYIQNAQRLANVAPSAYNKILLMLSKCQADCIVLNGVNDKQLYEQAIEIIAQNKQFSYFSFYFKTFYAYSLIVNKHKIQDALNVYLTLEKELKSNENSTLMASVYYNIGIANSSLKNFTYSNEYLQKSLNILNKYFPTSLDLIWNCTKVMAENLNALKKYEMAWVFKLRADSILQIKLQSEREYNFRSLQTQYQIKKKEQENNQLQLQKKWGIAAIIIVFFLLLIIAVLFLKTKNQNKKLQLSGVFRDKIYSVISHDLRSPLIALQDLTEQVSHFLQTKKFERIDTLAKGITESTLKMNNLLNNLLVWSIKEKINVAENVNIAHCINQCVALYSTIAQNKQILIVDDIDCNVTIKIKKSVLELIVRNWLDNTIKYANCSKINFTLHSTQQQYSITITDNGTIKDNIANIIAAQLHESTQLKTETATGLGLSLMAYFTEKEGWKTQLNTTPNNNKFTIIIPNKI